MSMYKMKNPLMPGFPDRCGVFAAILRVGTFEKSEKPLARVLYLSFRKRDLRKLYAISVCMLTK